MMMVDAHLDLAMNALEWNRDLTKPIGDIRAREAGLTDKPDRGRGTVSLPELRNGNIGIVVATQIARVVKKGSALPGWHSPEQAWAQTQGQLAWYESMEAAGEMRSIRDLAGLEEQLSLWNDEEGDATKKPIGYIRSLEGADSLVNLSYLEKSYRSGLRALGPAHYGDGRYAGGTGTEDGFTAAGKELLKEMESLNIILDVTHLTDKGFSEAINQFRGHIWASHHNCRALVNHQRQLTDDQIKTLIERGAVIGGVMDAWMLTDGWVRGTSDPANTGTDLNRLIDHYDHICQLAGNANHIAIGSDLDGAFGTEQSPADVNSIADLQRLPDLLSRRGYSPDDIESILQGNWLRFLRIAWKTS